MHTWTIRWMMLRTIPPSVYQPAAAAPQAHTSMPDQRMIAIVIDEAWTLLWNEEKAATALPEAAPNSGHSPLA